MNDFHHQLVDPFSSVWSDLKMNVELWELTDASCCPCWILWPSADMVSSCRTYLWISFSGESIPPCRKQLPVHGCSPAPEDHVDDHSRSATWRGSDSNALKGRKGLSQSEAGVKSERGGHPEMMPLVQQQQRRPPLLLLLPHYRPGHDFSPLQSSPHRTSCSHPSTFHINHMTGRIKRSICKSLAPMKDGQRSASTMASVCVCVCVYMH